ncbi:transmembrane protein 69-like [Lampris incognitus]|uniref:transmembrane protein 69-like n=1 Tax=Lampris incognitus TaxID=2546036 RepID=UPI0024B51183|nr:transmembrane protein 69-like [Lampris incognitus]XP_056133687.1 transmembrane protein 69-like [Lampris incognitus]XP_056133689.1 transmembrane protein 69-like [Lampris incognitus]
MLFLTFRGGTLTTQKVWGWTSTQRSMISTLARARGGASRLQPCWASPARLSSNHNAATGLPRNQIPAVTGLVNTTSFQWSQTRFIGGLPKIQPFHTSAVCLKKRPKPEPPPRELDLLRYDMKDLWKSPKPALYLGFARLIPFVALPLFMAATETYFPELAYAQVAYGAAIVSFLGGARWGFALPESSPAKPDWLNLANSVVPPLLAWAAILLSDSIISGITMVIMSFGISLHYDLSLLPTYPSWFKALHTVLTAVACLSLLSTLFVSQVYPEKMIFSE